MESIQNNHNHRQLENLEKQSHIKTGEVKCPYTTLLYTGESEQSELRLVLRTLEQQPTTYKKSELTELNQKWHYPNDWEQSEVSGRAVVARVTEIKGSYEVLTRNVDLTGIRERYYIQKKKRERTEQNKKQDIERVYKRAKQKVRHLIKSGSLDTLLTYTIRETENSGYLTREQVMRVWKYMTGVIFPRNNIQIDYVAVLEKHKKGNYHIHVATNSRVKANVLRAMWKRALSTEERTGNVDLSFKSNYSQRERTRKMSGYLSKYITKTMETDPNKKRYMSNVKNLTTVKYIIMKQDRINTIIDELMRILDLKPIETLNYIHYIDAQENVLYIDTYQTGIINEPPF